MLRAVLFRCLFLGFIFYIQVHQCSWAAASRFTGLKLTTSVLKSNSPVISGDKVTFNINVQHETSSQANALDAVLKINFPIFLKLDYYQTRDGLSPTRLENTASVLKFQFSKIRLSEKIKLTLVVGVDPYFIDGRREIVHLSAILNLWYYGQDGPCARPASYYNAKHEERRLNVDFLASKACEQRVQTAVGAPIKDRQYFASSISPGGEAHLASLSNAGVWVPAESYGSDRNQFLQIDFERLMKVTKIATRGRTTPYEAFVRTYHLYHSKNLIEWSGYKENHQLKTFNANSNGKHLVASYIPLPITAKFIRIVPRTWKVRQALEVEVYGCPAHPRPTLSDFCPIFDFESTLDGWSKTGTAFDNQPTIGDNLRARTSQSADIQGHGWIATAENRKFSHLQAGDMQGDQPKGTVTSPKFFIASSKLYFLIGGTANSSKTRAELLIDETVVRTSNGVNEVLQEKVWNVREFLGKEAMLRLVDDATDGHINFDALRVNCHLDGDAEDIILSSRSVLLNPSTHAFYVCDSTHLRDKDDSRCRMTTNTIEEWIDLPDILGLLGVDKSANKLYAVSNDRHVVVSLRKFGRDWQYITRSEWEEAKLLPTMVLAREVHLTSKMDDAAEQILVDLVDDNGEKWRATSAGISFKGVGQSWLPIASWYCHVSSVSANPCVSEPCQHSTKCENTSPGQYHCTCLPGYTGVNCEQNIDDCLNHDCLNNATCVDGLNNFFCACNDGYSGTKCEIELSACQNSPCQNGGTCVDLSPGDFKCDCLNGYRGTSCEIVFDMCKSDPCRNGGKCVPGVDSYHCMCPDLYYGTTCQHAHRSNFVVLSTKQVQETNNYLVIKAQIPSHGQSLWENWCRDYELLCMSQDGRLPTGLGLSYNHIEDLATCQRNYSSVMDRAGVLGATPNVEVARLAQSVGYTNATASNSFAFNSCSQKNCSKILPHSGCDSALSCISRAVPNNEVFTVCTDSDSNFGVYKKRWGIYWDINLLTLTVKGTSRYSRHENWCRDYQKLCKSFGLRPAGRGTNYLGKVDICRDKYHSLVFSINIDGNAIKNAGKTTTSHYFTFYDCNRCSSYSYSTRYALDQFYYSHYYHSTACTGPQGVAFRVLDEKAVSLNGSEYLAIKAQVPVDGKSKGSDWCEDYQSLCESYGLKPVGCGGQCITKYSAALKSGGPGCQASRTKVKQIANDAGFSQATETNSFALNDCNGCSSRISDRECLEEDLFCLNAHNPYRVVYTVCVNDRNAIKVIETRSTFYESTPYLVVKTELPSNGEYGLQNWCEEYQQLCESFDKKPTGCGAAYSSDPLYSSCHNNYSSVMPINDHLGCGKYSVAGEIATKVGFSDAYWFNTFIFHQCSPNNCTTRLTYGCSEDCKCHPSLNCINSTISSSNRRAYAICVGADSAFEVLDTRETDFNGDDLLVVKARLPSDGVAAYQNWCEDYRRLCLSYRRRPTGCGSDYSHEIGYSRCRTRYQSVMPEHNVYGCPPDRTVSTIALSVGFTLANSDNSFAFSDCTNSCVKTLTIGNQFINISVPNREVYTICSTSNSNFKVASNRETYYRGGYFLFVEAEVPSHYRSKHADWCTDYQRMCESYGLRPVGLNAREVSDRYASCIKRHGAVNTERVEATEKGQVKLLGGKLGYTQIDNCNSFTLNEYCDNHCHDDLLSFEPDRYKSLYCISRNHIENSNFLVYTVCASSDSNFHVISSKSLVYHGQNYLVVMATLPSHRESKYESWCKDYERLCRTFKMRPVGCSTSYQWSSNYRSCVEKFRSVMVENSPLGCNSSETVASVANMAGFHSAYPNNSFTFHQCSGEGSCPKKLTKSCPESLSCLNGQSDVVYTVCTDSASAFIVEYVGNSRERDLPLLVIGATLPAVQEPKSEDWCLDYQKLCESFAARPMSCDATKGNIYRSCSSDYNALAPSDEIQRCFNDGASDIKRLVDLIPGLDGGRYFKFHICSKANCESPIADTLCHNSLYCLKQNSNYVYTVCSRSSSNFEVVETSSTSYEEFDDILAIKARVPIHGQSLYDTWCHDYEKACSLFGKKPLACPLHTDYVEESRYHSCREDFNGYMMKNSSLTCPMSDFVANVSKLAGFSSASPANSIALSTCSSCSNTLNFVSDSTSNMTYLSLSALSTCPPHAVCSSWSPNVIPPEIYMLCVKPPKVSTFEVKETRKVSYQGRKFTVFRLTAPHDELSIFGDWCTDYQKLCESVSMRPITCGSGYTHIKRHRDCRSRYNAIMLRGFSCSPHSSIRRVVAQAGFSVDTSRTFGMLNCMYCGANLRGTDALHYIRYAGGFLYTACANTDGAFNVIQTRNVVVSSISFMVLKAHLPKNLLSSHESWCKDYQMMCESYGKRPLSCPEIGMCKVTYNSLSVGSVKCGDASNLQYIPRSAGFLEATKDNTFVLQSCEINQCSRRIPDEGCDGALGCINSMISNREVYTMCISSTTAYDVIATKEVEYSSRKYLVVRVKLPSHGISKYYSWCHDYSELCREYSLRPLTCLNSRCIDFHHAIWLTSEACPVTSGISFIASRADMTQVTDNTNFAFSTHCFGSQCKKVAYDTNCTENGKHPLNCYDRTLNDGEFTTLCVGPNTETAFPIIDFRTVSYSERNYLVVRTQKRRRESQKGNWCHDYRYLCESFRMRPLACPEQYSINSYHHYCKRNYLAVMMDNVDHGCPINEFVAELAQLAGFTGANSGNSFAFHNCSGHHCTKVLREEDCNEGLYCLNTISSQRDLYTACAASYDSGFTVVDYKTVSHNSKTYDVIQVTVSENQRSLHENWCRDYQRLCASFQRIPLECYNPGETVSSDICTDSFGASRQIECGNTARSIASKSGFSSVQGKTIVMHRCTDCPKVMTKTCTHSLDCARAGAGSLYVICAEQKTVSGGTLKPLQTRSLIYGLESYLLIQTHLLNYYSKLRDWRQEYIKLCSLFGYLPIACGEYSSDNNNDVNYCRSKYNVLSSKGDDFGCPPSETIAIIARQVGFYEANKRNTFAMYKCGASYSTTLSSSSCHGHLSCLLRSPPKGIVYTMCAKPIPSNSLGFQVLDKKKITFLRTNYLALKVKIDVDGNALLDNWCYDYRELCRQFNMVPTGCGSQNEDDIPFSKCKTKYNSFMPYSNVLRCESVTRPAAIVRKAGFPNADKKNTFVFNRCDKCVKRLSSTGGCDSALLCLHVDVWKKEAYTLCVDRLSGFEVLGTRETSYDNKEFLVIEAALPEDARAIHDNWCQDYQKMCYSFGKFPVACSIDANTADVRKYAKRYGAATVESIPCSPVATVVSIARSAGYLQAKSGNSFVFAAHSDSDCPKDMGSSGCTAALDCVNSKSRVVYTLCTNPTHFEISDVKYANHEQNTFTVIEARIPVTGLSKAATWCDDYASLCRAIKQQPVACQSLGGLEEYGKCSEDYGAYTLTDKYRCLQSDMSLHEIAQIAGFPDASFGNTFGFKACSSQTCQKQLYVGPECDPSLNCINDKVPNRQVFALCIKDGNLSNFEVQETKQIETSNILYLAIRALVPSHGKSKHETWCKDYERVCQAQSMRPVRCFSEQNRDCLGQFHALVVSTPQFDCRNNSKLVKFLKNAGFNKSSSNNTFIYGTCASSKLCRERLRSSQCDDSLNCLKRPSVNREVFMVCARSLATSFIYHEARSTFYAGAHYLVIKASLAANGISTNQNWCYDYREMCASFGKRPVVRGSLSSVTDSYKAPCFSIYNGTATHHAVENPRGLAESAGFNPGNCAASFVNCCNCFETFQHCPFGSCNCVDFYLICL